MGLPTSGSMGARLTDCGARLAFRLIWDSRPAQRFEQVFPNAITQAELTNDYYYNNFWGANYCFFDTCYEHYWSSTNLSGRTDLIWVINFSTGVMQWDSYYQKNLFTGLDLPDKPKKKSVRCVAGA